MINIKRLHIFAGYLYNFPFLHESCGIVVEENCVEPLYKHLVNIRHPSMCLIGVPYYVCAFSMFDLQVSYRHRVYVMVKVINAVCIMPEYSLNNIYDDIFFALNNLLG